MHKIVEKKILVGPPCANCTRGDGYECICKYEAAGIHLYSAEEVFGEIELQLKPGFFTSPAQAQEQERLLCKNTIAAIYLTESESVEKYRLIFQRNDAEKYFSKKQLMGWVAEIQRDVRSWYDNFILSKSHRQVSRLHRMMNEAML